MNIFKNSDFVSLLKISPVPDSSNKIPVSSVEENEEREQRRLINDKIEKRELERIKSSLKEGRQIDLDVYIGPGKSIMSLATEHNDIELLKLLLDRGADINICDAIGNTALHTAIVKNNNFLCEYLLKKGANPNIKSKITNDTPLNTAILFGNVSAIKFLIQYNANINDAQAAKLMENTELHLNKEYYSHIKTVLLLLYNNNYKDLRFLILSYLPEYHCHSGLYKELQDRKFVLKPSVLNMVNGHINIVQEILYIKNKNNQTVLELYPSIRKLNEKLLADYNELSKNYPESLISMRSDNLAFGLLKRYVLDYKLLIPEDALGTEEVD